MVSILVKSYQGVSVESKNVLIENSLKNVADLKHLIGQSFKLKENEFELVRRGLRMKDDEEVDCLKEGSVLYVLKSVKKVQHVAESVDESTMCEVIQSMKQLLSKSHTKNIWNEKMKDKKIFECIIEAVPAFGQDSIAIDVLSSIPLLYSIFIKKEDQAKKFLDEHRSMIHACLIMIEEVIREKGVTTETPKQDSKALYNIDHMSDDEEEEEDEDMETNETSDNPSRRNHNNLRTSIRPFEGGAAGPSSQPTPSNTITNDFFRRAMRAINTRTHTTSPLNTTSPFNTTTTLNNPPQSTPNTLPTVITETQLQQMSELGVSDLTLARSLLTQCQGDLQAAIALYYHSQDQ